MVREGAVLNPGVPIIPTAGMPVAGMPTAGMPVAGMPVAGMPVAGMPVAGMPGAGMPVAGMPTAGMPVAGMPVAGMPTAGMPVAGMPTAGMPVAGMPTAGMPVAGMPVAGMPTAGMPVAGMPTAGMPVAGMPVTIVTVAGQPLTIPSMGSMNTLPNQSSTTTDDTSTLTSPLLMTTPQSTQTSITGIQQMGQTSAGVVVSGQPATIPPMGQTSALTVAGVIEIPAVTVAGANQGSVCIASEGKTIKSQVARLFDRAPYFLIVNLGGLQVFPNPNVKDLMDAGVQSAQLVVSEGARSVITNDIGIRAIEEFNRLNVKVYTGVTETVEQALQWYQNGRLTATVLNASNQNDEEEEHGASSMKVKSKGETSTTKTL
ncbi:Magnetosome protein MamT-Star [Candidatus Magnetomoraceae bacterium gMMP-15]